MFHSEQLQEKWAPLLEYDGLDSIKDPHRKAVTAVLLENQEKFLKETSSFENGGSLLNEAAPTNSTGSSVDNFDPVLISLIRRSMPNLIAYDLAGVQPMSGPTGLIFAMRSRYQNQSGTEAFYNEPDSAFSGQNFGRNLDWWFLRCQCWYGYYFTRSGTNPSVLNPVGSASSIGYNVGQGMTTANAEALGDAAAGMPSTRWHSALRR